MTSEEARKIFEFPVRWGDTYIEWEDAKKREQEARELTKGFKLLTTQQRSWYEDSWTESVPDYFELARLIEKIRSET